MSILLLPIIVISLIKNCKVMSRGSSVSFAAILIMLVSVLGACGGGGADRVRQEQLNEVKESALENLNEMLHDLEQRVEFLEEHIEEAEGEAKAELEEARELLEEQKEELEGEIAKIDEATLDTWNEVIENTSQVIQQVRTETNEIINIIREHIE